MWCDLANRISAILQTALTIGRMGKTTMLCGDGGRTGVNPPC